MKEKLMPIKLPPGYFKNGTEYQGKGRWIDGNFVRFYENTVRPIGRWQRLQDSAGADLGLVTGCPRFAYSYRGNAGAVRLGIGTTAKAYVVTAGALVEITPGGLTAGSCTGTYNDGSGIYGAGCYGCGAYGGISLASTLVDADTWTLDNFGDFLLGVLTSDGKLWYWDGNSANDFVQASGSPIDNRGVVVTPERFIFALGAGGDPRLVKWATQEGGISIADDWTASATNSAGEFPLSSKGRLMSGRRTRRQTLLFTDVDVWTANFIGGDLIYSFDQAGDHCGLIAPNAVATVDSKAFWMGKRSFYMFDGRVVPIPCEVSDYVFGSFNNTNRALINAVTNIEFGEIWWFYPSAGAVENDRAVVYNYRENHWTTHAMPRACGVDREVLPAPTWVTGLSLTGVAGSGVIYEHEAASGLIDSPPFIRTGPYEIDGGDKIFRVQSVLPDENTRGDLKLRIRKSYSPTDAPTTSTLITLSDSAPIGVRFTARQMWFDFVENVAKDWRLGEFRIGVRPQGSR